MAVFAIILGLFLAAPAETALPPDPFVTHCGAQFEDLRDREDVASIQCTDTVLETLGAFHIATPSGPVESRAYRSYAFVEWLENEDRQRLRANALQARDSAFDIETYVLGQKCTALSILARATEGGDKNALMAFYRRHHFLEIRDYDGDGDTALETAGREVMLSMITYRVAAAGMPLLPGDDELLAKFKQSIAAGDTTLHNQDILPESLLQNALGCPFAF